MAEHYHRLQVEERGDVTIVHFTDKKILDDAIIQDIGEQLLRVADTLGQRELLLNFGNVEYLSSAAIGTLVLLNTKVETAGGRLVLCNLAPVVYEVFELTKLNELFRITLGPDDPEGHGGTVASRLTPPKPSGDDSATLPPPPPE